MCGKVRVNPRVQCCTLRHTTELLLATTAYDPVEEQRRREKHTCRMPYRLGWATCPFHRVQTRPLGRMTSHTHDRNHLDSQSVSTAPNTTHNLSSYAMYVVVSFISYAALCRRAPNTEEAASRDRPATSQRDCQGTTC